MVDILLVEDNPDDAQLTLRVLSTEPSCQRVQVVSDGVEALEYLTRTGRFSGRTDPDPKLVLLDMKLPRMGGLEVLRRAREHPKLARLPIVVLTSSQESSDVQASYELGANSYIVKPVDFEQFRRVVREVGVYWASINRSPE